VAPRLAGQGAAGVSWSAHQVALLQGMGFDTLRLRGAGDFARAPAGAAVGAASAATASSSHTPARAVSQGSGRIATGSRQTDVWEVAATAAPTAAPTGKLLAALRLAAGGRDPLALAGDLDALRRDPARKRELWPRLRALRRPH
jgi:hypothetical protein